MIRLLPVPKLCKKIGMSLLLLWGKRLFYPPCSFGCSNSQTDMRQINTRKQPNLIIYISMGTLLNTVTGGC